MNYKKYIFFFHTEDCYLGNVNKKIKNKLYLKENFQFIKTRHSKNMSTLNPKNMSTLNSKNMSTLNSKKLIIILKIIKGWVFSLFLAKITLSLPFLAAMLNPELVFNLNEYISISIEFLTSTKKILIEDPLNFFKNFILELKNKENKMIIESQKESLLDLENKLIKLENQLEDLKRELLDERKKSSQSEAEQRFVAIGTVLVSLTKLTVYIYKFFKGNSNNDVSFTSEDKKALQDIYSIVKNGIEPGSNPNNAIIEETFWALSETSSELEKIVTGGKKPKMD